MNTVFARALVTLTLVALPASALASTKAGKADKAKHGHSHALLAKKEPKAKKAKHPGHKSSDDKALATRAASPSEPSAAKARSAHSHRHADSAAVASHHAHKDSAPVASKAVPAEPLVQ